MFNQTAFSLNEKDSLKLKAMDEHAWNMLFADTDSARIYAQNGLEFATACQSGNFQARFHNIIASAYYLEGNFPKAIEEYQESVRIAEKIGDLKGAAYYTNNLGNIFFELDDYAQAEFYYKSALEIQEKLQNKTGLGLAYSNLSILAEKQKNFPDAFRKQQKAIVYRAESDSAALAESYFNMASLYQGMIDLSDDSLKLVATELNITNNFSTWKNSLLDSAVFYLEKSKFLHEKFDNIYGVGVSLKGLGDVAYRRGNFVLAKNLLTQSYAIAEELGAQQEKRDLALLLYKTNRATGNTDKALEWHEKYFEFYKSLTREDMLNQVAKKEISFQYEKKSLADSLEYVQKEQHDKLVIAEQNARLDQERTLRIAFIIGLLLFIALSIVMYRNYRIKKRDNQIITEQKRETEEKKLIIEEKQKEILDSINYAKRLQQAILAKPEEISQFLPDNFLLYTPKDIVAGDFYFFEVTEKHIFYAAADCTGHGVPGALVSIVCSNALSRSVKEFQLEIPGEILDKTRELVVQTFEKSGQDVKDGMDISFIAIERKTKAVSWAGANNPLWYLQRGEIKEITATKQPIGKTDQPVPFKTHQLNSEIETVYLFTDGFADQFGGPKGKKYKYATLKEFLLRHAAQPLSEQKNSLLNELNSWMNWPDANGALNAFEQLDDICVVGIKLGEI